MSFNIDEDLSEMLTVQYSWVQTKLFVLFPVKMSMASMEKHLFNLKFAAKELERNSKKCDKVYNLFTTSSTFPVILKELIDELMRKNTTKTNFYHFAKKKMDDEKSFIGILFCSLISLKEEKAEKLKLKKAIEKGNMEVTYSMVLILMMQYFLF